MSVGGVLAVSLLSLPELTAAAAKTTRVPRRSVIPGRPLAWLPHQAGSMINYINICCSCTA